MGFIIRKGGDSVKKTRRCSAKLTKRNIINLDEKRRKAKRRIQAVLRASEAVRNTGLALPNDQCEVERG